MGGLSFLSPLYLLGILAIAVPIALHLFRRRTDVVVEFPAIRLLVQTPVEQQRRKRLRELILLALRVTALVLLAGAFARPYLAGRILAAEASVTVVAVDRSFSLSAPGVFDRARALAIDAVSEAPSTNAVALVVFDESADLVLALNAALGNVGTTIEYHEPVDALLPATPGLGELAAAMQAGAVKTLVVLGANPAYDAPADLGFAGVLGKVEEVIHLGSHVDETGALASWHVPAAHFLEAWDDARASCGTLSVVQPLILPLFGGKSALEVMGLLASGADRPGHDLVQETWRGILQDGDFERRWNRVVHDGLTYSIPRYPSFRILENRKSPR